MPQEPSGLLNYLPRLPGTMRRKGYKDRRRRRTLRVFPGTGKPTIGKLKQGELSSLGYSVSAKPSTRHRAVDRAVARYGKLSTLRKLNAVAVYTRRTSPKKSRTFKSDVRYVQKKYY